MSETPKYDLRSAKIGSLADKVEGNQISIHHNYAPAQNLGEEKAEIKQLVERLAQIYPTTTLAEKWIIVAQGIEHTIKQNPTLKQRLRSALKAGGIEALKVIFNHPLISIPIETIKGWVEAD